MRLPQKGEAWRHFKGTIYRIVGFSWDAEPENLRLVVHYQKWTNPNAAVFSRTLWNFLGPVDDRAHARFEIRDDA